MEVKEQAVWKCTVVCPEKDPSGRDKEMGKGCGSKMEVTIDDLLWLTWYGTHFAHKAPGIVCPVCSRKVFVEDCPDWVRGALTKRKRVKKVASGIDDSIY